MEKKFGTVLDLQGRPVVGATVEVRGYPGGAVSTIYSDDGVTQTANPLTTSNRGYFEYYAADGHYTWVIVTNLETRTINDVQHHAV